MMYRALWADGREVLFRAPDEEQARLRATVWRRDEDPMFDNDIPANPTHVEQVHSRGPAGLILSGWVPGMEE